MVLLSGVRWRLESLGWVGAAAQIARAACRKGMISASGW